MPLSLRCPNPACRRDLVVPDPAAAPPRCPACGEPFPTDADTLTRDRPSGPSALPRRVGDSTAATRTTDPDRIGRFVVRRRLGHGAFGTVFHAYDPQLDRELAVKVPHRGDVADPTRVERFLREAKAAANLRHPNIVPVYDAGRDGDRYYIAAAFIDGEPLADAIPDGGVPFRRAAELVKELAEALAYAHAQGIVHRDVKPHNCMLDRKGHLHLMDFGLARRGDEADRRPAGTTTATDSRLTNDGDLLGTPAYMAPEQAAGKAAEVGPAADQYAAGVVLYQLLTGTTPFTGPAPVVVYNLLNRDPDPPSKLRRRVPKDLETVCLKAMARQPKGRYATCQKLADDLRRFLDGEPIAGRELNDLERAVRWVVRRPAAAAAALFGPVVGGLIVTISIAGGLAARARQERAFAVADRDEAVGVRTGLENALADSQAKLAEQSAKATAAKAELDGRVKELAAAEAARAADEKGELPRRRREAAELYAGILRVAGRTPGAADLILPACPPSARGWEWHAFGRPGVLVAAATPVGNPGELAALTGHKATVAAARFSPDGKRVVTASTDDTARIWEADTGKSVFALALHTGPVTAAVFRPDGRRVATASWDNTVWVWDADTGAAFARLKGHTGTVNGLAYSPNGDRLVTASDDKTARIWEADPGKLLATLTGHEGVVHAAAFSPDGKRVATGARDDTARVWEAATGKELLALKGHGNDVDRVAFSPDGKRILTAARDETARIWNADTGKELSVFGGHKGPVVAAFSPDGGRVVTASRDPVVRVWDADTGKELVGLTGHTDEVSAVAFSPDGRLVASAGDDKTARIWDAAAGKELAVLGGHTLGIQSVSFSPDGARVVTAGRDNTARVWAVGLPPAGPPPPPPTAWFGADGSRVYYTDAAGKVRAFDPVAGRPLPDPDPPPAPPPAPVRATPEGARELAIANGTVTVRDAASGVDLYAIPQPGVAHAAFSPDGHWVVTVGADGSVKAWDGRPAAKP